MYTKELLAERERENTNIESRFPIIALKLPRQHLLLLFQPAEDQKMIRVSPADEIQILHLCCFMS